MTIWKDNESGQGHDSNKYQWGLNVDSDKISLFYHASFSQGKDFSPSDSTHAQLKSAAVQSPS